jgi:hypothetical protein
MRADGVKNSWGCTGDAEEARPVAERRKTRRKGRAAATASTRCNPPGFAPSPHIAHASR